MCVAVEQESKGGNCHCEECILWLLGTNEKSRRKGYAIANMANPPRQFSAYL